jgi:hypothetical protein
MPIPKRMPDWPVRAMIEPSAECSYEAANRDREAIRKFREEADMCNELMTRRGLDKVMALAGSRKGD